VRAETRIARLLRMPPPPPPPLLLMMVMMMPTRAGDVLLLLLLLTAAWGWRSGEDDDDDDCDCDDDDDATWRSRIGGKVNSRHERSVAAVRVAQEAGGKGERGGGREEMVSAVCGSGERCDQ
jgi:hypothetical protein